MSLSKHILLDRLYSWELLVHHQRYHEDNLCDVRFANVAVLTNKNRTTLTKPPARIKVRNNITGIKSF